MMHEACEFEEAPDSSRIWLPELVERFASFLHPNDVACNLRLVNKATAAQLRGRREFTTVQLSQPVPAHAFARRWGTPGAMRSLTLYERRKLLQLTAASGSVPNLELALAHVGLVLTSTDWVALLRAAAAAGQLEMCEWLLPRQRPGWDQFAKEAAAQSGHQAVCELLLASGAVCDGNMCIAAARGGHPDLLDWLLLRCEGGPIGPEDSLMSYLTKRGSAELMVAAARGCSQQVLQRLWERCFGGPQPEDPEDPLEQQQQQCLRRHLSQAMDAAAGSPTPDWRAKVEWLETKLTRPSRSRQCSCCAAAAACPDALAQLTWLRQRGYAVGSWALVAAVRAGNVAALEYLLDEGADVSQRDEWVEAEAGLDALTVLHAHGYPMEPSPLAWKACGRGHLPVVVWAVEELGAEVQGEQMLDQAASSSSVELMAWLRQRGASWSSTALGRLAESGCEEALEWAVAQGCPLPDNGDPYVKAASEGDLATLRCLHRLGCPWGPAGDVFHRCVLGCVHLPILQWLARKGCPVDWQAALAAAQKAAIDYEDEDKTFQYELVAWLAEQQRLHSRGNGLRQAAAVPPPPPLQEGRQQQQEGVADEQ